MTATPSETIPRQIYMTLQNDRQALWSDLPAYDCNQIGEWGKSMRRRDRENLPVKATERDRWTKQIGQNPR